MILIDPTMTNTFRIHTNTVFSVQRENNLLEVEITFLFNIVVMVTPTATAKEYNDLL
jgi:hypothetical protein